MVLKNNCLKNIKIPEASGQQSVNMHDQAVDYTGGHPENISLLISQDKDSGLLKWCKNEN